MDINGLLKQLVFAGGVVLLFSCSAKRHTLTFVVRNPTTLYREHEMLEIPIRSLDGWDRHGKSWIIQDEQGQQVPCQITHDSLLIFPVTAPPLATVTFRVTDGIPIEFDTLVCGKIYPERLDDMAWENDKAAYRAYGPALQKSGERAFGYDLLTKSVNFPVLEQRYRMQTDSMQLARIDSLIKLGRKQAADSIRRAISYHIDHGNGMDCYSVGATLGGGTAALLDHQGIIYPYCYRTCDILDNGPLRFSARLTYHPFALGKDSNIIETRLITLDKGSYLNRTEVMYHNLSSPNKLVAGIVLHPQNKNGYRQNFEARYIAYADSTDNPRNGNGVIYVGVVFDRSLERTGVVWFDEKERRKRSGALGHVLGYATYMPGKQYRYYWGSGWSKSDIPDMTVWEHYLRDYALKTEKPLRVEIINHLK